MGRLRWLLKTGLCVGLLCVIALQCALPSFAETLKFQVGDQNFQAEIPEGFQILQKETNQQAYDALMGLIPPSQNVLFVLMKKEPLHSTNKILAIFMFADQRMQNMTVTQAQFDMIIAPLSKNFEASAQNGSLNQSVNTLLDKADASLDKAYKADIDLDTTNTAMLGSFRTGSNAWTGTVYQKVKVATQANTSEMKQLTTASMLLLKGKFMSLGVASGYADNNDVIYIQGFTRGLIQRLNSLNAEVKAVQSASL